MLDFKEFSDGIAFYYNNKEIAFYSFINERVRYAENCYKDFCTFNCAEIPFEHNMYIMDKVKEYMYTESDAV